jgi:hypothetical protein
MPVAPAQQGREGLRALLGGKILETIHTAPKAVTVDRPEMRLLRAALFDGDGAIGIADGMTGMNLDGIELMQAQEPRGTGHRPTRRR